MLIYILLLLLLWGAILIYFRIADYFHIIDKPNQRSSHTLVTIRGGGIIFYVGVLLWFLCFGFHQPYFFAGLTLIAGISFMDDIKPLAAKLRLVVHLFALLLMCYEWGMGDMPWYFIVLALVVSTGIINAFNFMDGINGMTGGYSVVVTGALWYINNYEVAFIDNRFIYVVLLSLLVFDFFNFRKKARCFAGDVGAVSIAFILLFMVGKLIMKTDDFSFLVLFVVYGVDTFLTIVHRLMLKENILEAHRKHVFQLMANELKLSHQLVSSIYAVLQVVILVGYVRWEWNRYVYLLGVVFILSLIYVFFMKKYFKLHIVSR